MKSRAGLDGHSRIVGGEQHEQWCVLFGCFVNTPRQGGPAMLLAVVSDDHGPFRMASSRPGPNLEIDHRDLFRLHEFLLGRYVRRTFPVLSGQSSFGIGAGSSN